MFFILLWETLLFHTKGQLFTVVVRNQFLVLKDLSPFTSYMKGLKWVFKSKLHFRNTCFLKLIIYMEKLLSSDWLR